MNMDEIYGLKLNSQFLDKLNYDTKVWIAKAMINCIKLFSKRNHMIEFFILLFLNEVLIIDILGSIF